jgi:hypothetical protein
LPGYNFKEPPMTQMPPRVPDGGYGGPPHALQPHRGAIVLVLGILGLVICFICGIIAWVMGKQDLAEMDAGRMDPSGRSLTQAGKICGMISVILVCVGLGVWLIGMVLMGLFAAASATGV